MSTRPQAVLAIRQTTGLSAHDEAVLREHEVRENDITREALESAIDRFERWNPRFRLVVGYVGPVSMSFVTGVATSLEADGRRVSLQWMRDTNGLIDGIAICERVQP